MLFTFEGSRRQRHQRSGQRRSLCVHSRSRSDASCTGLEHSRPGKCSALSLQPYRSADWPLTSRSVLGGPLCVCVTVCVCMCVCVDRIGLVPDQSTRSNKCSIRRIPVLPCFGLWGLCITRVAQSDAAAFGALWAFAVPSARVDQAGATVLEVSRAFAFA